MRFNKLVNWMHDLWVDSVSTKSSTRIAPIFLLGRPGIGKSDATKAAADRMTQTVREQSGNPNSASALFDAYDLTGMDAMELAGVPKYDQVGDIAVTRMTVQSRVLPFINPKAYGVFCMDDITQASPDVQVAARKTALYGRIGDYQIGSKVMVAVTGNRRQDQSGATRLPAHFLNSVCVMEIDVDVEDWVAWYAKDSSHHPAVAGYVLFRGLSVLSQVPADADENGSFATPRSWAKVGRVLALAERNDTVKEVVNGQVGAKVGIEFAAFLTLRASFDVAAILLDPKGQMPNPSLALSTPDKTHALLISLGELAGSWKKANDPRAQGKAGAMLLRAVAHIAMHSKENAMTSFHAYSMSGGSFPELTALAPHVPEARPLFAAIASALNKATG